MKQVTLFEFAEHEKELLGDCVRIALKSVNKCHTRQGYFTLEGGFYTEEEVKALTQLYRLLTGLEIHFEAHFLKDISSVNPEIPLTHLVLTPLA